MLSKCIQMKTHNLSDLTYFLYLIINKYSHSYTEYIEVNNNNRGKK